MDLYYIKRKLWSLQGAVGVEKKLAPMNSTTLLNEVNPVGWPCLFTRGIWRNPWIDIRCSAWAIGVDRLRAVGSEVITLPTDVPERSWICPATL